MWSEDEDDALNLIDTCLKNKYDEIRSQYPNATINVQYMWNASSGLVDIWHKYCQKQKRDSYHELNSNIYFENDKIKKEDYASFKLSYPLIKSDIKSYERLVSVLYDKENRHKIEWSIGSIVSGDSKKLQKFIVLYGSAGTGKSTILNIIEKLFKGYTTYFNAKSLINSNNDFALEPFKNNPLVAIQHDGDLSKIEDNTRLNSLVSHETMTVNEKFKSIYKNSFKAFLYMGTNKPVKITDAKSGLIRRLIDLSPTGNKVPTKEYNQLMSKIDFELGGIAYHCLQVYKKDPHYYDNYKPLSMMSASNDFYNFVSDNSIIFEELDGITLKRAWEMYQKYVLDTRMQYPFSQRVFKEELKNYFETFEDRARVGDERIRNYYRGFKKKMIFNDQQEVVEEKPKNNSFIEFKEQDSIFDKVCKNNLAQLASEDGKPTSKWVNVKTKLKDINTKELHYVQLDSNHIVLDFDIKGEDGKKSITKNIEAIKNFPSTYAELSKSGNGIHLHYIYEGDPSVLSNLYDENIEIKVFTGNSSLRRKLTKCNNLEITKINSGLPIKEENRKMISNNILKSEKSLRDLITRNLRKEFHPGTKPSIDFINKILSDAYKSGLEYDISDMKDNIYTFALNSTNQSDYCVKLVSEMKFKSEDKIKDNFIESERNEIVFYDIETFKNLFLVIWKKQGSNSHIVLVNPSAEDIKPMLKFRLVGFNCRKFDNHLIYAKLLGYSVIEIYNLAKRLISKDESRNGDCYFREAYNLSYTDVYDFASAANKMSLKKLEIKMGISHKELNIPWDIEVTDDMIPKIIEYCKNDVDATEAAFKYLENDWIAREILSDISNMSTNSTTNMLTERIIFGKDPEPQKEFIYRDLGKPVEHYDKDVLNFLEENKRLPIPYNVKSLLPYFEGYEFKDNTSTYMGIESGEGGYVYSKPGMYENVSLFDVVSMHPTSLINECYFGPNYTKRFLELVNARIYIKHKEYDKLDTILGGVLDKYVDNIKSGKLKAKSLSNALKTAINSVYGLTAAKFPNKFKDPRNKDNIVAKRGALFMITLQKYLEDKGVEVIHIKTDSIKIANCSEETKKDIFDMAKVYGYEFEHEATYDKFCLVNDAVYICREGEEWSATGTQFAVPYVFKSLFSGEEITFDDLCETKTATTNLYIDLNESLKDVSLYEKELKKLESQYKKSEIEEDVYLKEKARLDEIIKEGHNYIFVGKVGRFSPVIPSMGGGDLVREKDGKYYSVTGSKGYRWVESDILVNDVSKIDMSYYEHLKDEAKKAIEKYGSFEEFVK